MVASFEGVGSGIGVGFICGGTVETAGDVPHSRSPFGAGLWQHEPCWSTPSHVEVSVGVSTRTRTLRGADMIILQKI